MITMKPYYQADEIADMLGITRDALAKIVLREGIARVKVRRGKWGMTARQLNDLLDRLSFLPATPDEEKAPDGQAKRPKGAELQIIRKRKLREVVPTSKN